MSELLDEPIASNSVEQRFAMRMSRPEAYAQAKLKVGSRMVNVRVIDESAGGFLVEVDRAPARFGNKPLELIDHAGRHPLRVIWHRRVEGKVRLGLQRLPEYLDDQRESYWFIWMLAAIIFGLSLGYVVSNRGRVSFSEILSKLNSPAATIRQVEP